MDEIRLALLKGLQQSGKNKTFAQILNDAKVDYKGSDELEAANSLESLGLIKAIKLPSETRAELTSFGVEFLQSLP